MGDVRVRLKPFNNGYEVVPGQFGTMDDEGAAEIKQATPGELPATVAVVFLDEEYVEEGEDGMVEVSGDQVEFL